MLKEAKLGNTTIDLVIPPSLKQELKNKMNDAQISYDVTISDLQTAIDAQNHIQYATIRNSKAGNAIL